MKVLLLSRYGPLGASSRVRLFQYVEPLRRAGIELTVAPLLGDDYIRDLYAGRRRPAAVAGAYLRRLRDLLGSRRYRLLWIEKELLPWLPAWAETLLALRGVPYLVDIDDAVFHSYDLHPRPLVRRALGTKIDAVMRHAALVVAGNDYLADRARQAGARRVAVLPTVVDPDRYQPAPPPGGPVLTIGWIGTPATARYLKEIRAPLAEVCRDGDARVVLVGAEASGLDGVPVETRPWSEETEAAEVGRFDLGIMPLPDGPWERGKCGYKLIQYLAGARPAVASPVGVNCQIVEHGVSGFLASTPDEWVQALRALQADPDRRERMGRAGRRAVEERYSMQVVAPRLLSLLHSVGGS